MCGIAGFLTRRVPPHLPLLRSMCDQIRHRGPDDEGYYADDTCAIGMRRLSIIDLSTGHQPISNEDGSIWVVFNGEIYNYQQLRRELMDLGHRFATSSDTEVLVHLYEQEGPAGLSRLRGMFAFAVWDTRLRRILLARDRFGKKPLYFAASPEGLYFASELKCLRAAGVPLEFDPEALRLYFLFGYIPDPYTPFRGIRKLSAGGFLTYDLNGTLHQDCYWHFPAPAEAPAQGASLPEARRRLTELFDESVRIRMLADVPLGAFLSGGIDSSCVVASMAMQSSEPVKTFSIGFEEQAFNELDWARLVARKYSTDHHEILVRPDSVALVSRLVRHFDEPFADSSAIPTFIVSEFAVRHVKVALSGDGGDELFAGYEDVLARIEKLRAWDRVPLLFRHFLDRLSDCLPYSAYGKNYLRAVSRPSSLERYFESNYAPFHMRRALLAPEWAVPADAAFLSRTLSHCLLPNGAQDLSQALYFEGTAKLTGDMLVKMDRMSMANSLEVRCPFLDHELATFATSLPHAWKFRGRTGKRIVREALGERLPPELLSRPKQGFGVPLSIWFRKSLRSMLWDTLTSRSLLDRGVVSPTFVRYLLNEHDSGRRDNCTWLWMLLIFELWCQEWSCTQNLPVARHA